MVLLVAITGMSSTDQVIKKTRQRNGRKKSSKTVGADMKKRVTKQKSRKRDDRKINNFFSPQNEGRPTVKHEAVNLTLEVAFDVSKEANNLNEKEYAAVDAAATSSTVGFLKMSPYRHRENTIPPSKICLESSAVNKKHSLCNLKNAETDSQSWDHSYSVEVKKQKEPVKPIDTKITEFFPVRRSGRKTKSVIKKEEEARLIDAVQTQQTHGLEVVEFSSKGRGVIATRKFSRNEFVVEYDGDLITWSEAKERERFYSLDSAIGCYMYYFSAKGHNFCIDATAESGKLGRLLNHSRKSPNCYTKLVWVPNEMSREEEPHLVILAKQDIDKGEELTYDYGDRDKAALQVHPWLKA